ncbi:MAG TPA: alpha-L-rhamnosidase C-terminal domain-containing protein, partial [Iamia sp.]
ATGGATVTEVEARVVHTDVGPGNSFSCADPLLNQIDQNVRWTYRASFQGYPQDAADRGERVGWLGDPGWIIEDYLYCFDTLAYWSKWLDDIRDTQLPDGSVPIVTPIHWRGKTGWSVLPGFPYAKWPDFSAATYAVIAWNLYSYYGDRSILERHHDGLRAALAWTSSLDEQGIVGAGFGDHMEPLPDGSCSPLAELTPVALTSTAWYYATADVVARVAHVLGDAAGEEAARSRAEAIRATFNDTFFDAGTGRYADGSQTAQALPLWLGLVPDEHREAVGRNLVERIERDGGHLVTGTMGTPALEQVLADLGAPEVMLRIATWEDFPGWGFQVTQGATTIWETWGHAATKYPSSSRNMKLLAAISKFLYKDVAGISPLAPGWRRMLVKPCLTQHLDHAEARLATPRGDAAIAWRRRGESLTVDVTVPATSTAEVVLPLPAAGGVVEEGGTVLWADGRATPRPGLRDLLAVAGSLHLEAGGGTYRFTVHG